MMGIHNLNTGADDVEVQVAVKMKTKQAILVDDGDKDVWLPKSQAEIVEDGGKTFVQLPRWLAVDKGLV